MTNQYFPPGVDSDLFYFCLWQLEIYILLNVSGCNPMSMFLGQRMMTPFFKVHEINLVPKEEVIRGKLKPEFLSKGQTVFQLT